MPHDDQPTPRIHMRLTPEDAAVVAELRKLSGIQSTAELTRLALRALRRQLGGGTGAEVSAPGVG